MTLRDCAFVACLLAAIGLGFFVRDEVFAQDAKKPGDVERSISELSNRVVNHAWGPDTTVLRITIVPTSIGESENTAVLGLFEFELGKYGLYLATQDPKGDQCMLLTKNDAAVIEETAQRCRFH